MKKTFLFLLLLLSISINNFAQEMMQATNTKQVFKNMEAEKSTENDLMKNSIYQFTVKSLSEGEFDFAKLKGKKIMIVNTASKCGLTPQYKELQALYEKYNEKNFVIIGFPANNFGKQEPGTDDEISKFCSVNYGVTFPMMSKISVKGSDMAPIYQFLTKKEKNGLQDSDVEWNFQKYLINEKGQLEKVISPRTLPSDSSIADWILKS